MSKSKIEWTDKVWNPVTGCTKVSAGCQFCYAERIFPRVYGNDVVDNEKPELVLMRKRKFTDIKLHYDRLEQPLHWKKPSMIFVNSMSDLFHEKLTSDFLAEVYATMFIANQHIFQVLTKRPENALALYNHALWRQVIINSKILARGHRVMSDSKHEFPLNNLWLGISVENQKTADERILVLLQIPDPPSVEDY